MQIKVNKTFHFHWTGPVNILWDWDIVYVVVCMYVNSQSVQRLSPTPLNMSVSGTRERHSWLFSWRNTVRWDLCWIITKPIKSLHVFLGLWPKPFLFFPNLTMIIQSVCDFFCSPVSPKIERTEMRMKWFREAGSPPPAPSWLPFHWIYPLTSSLYLQLVEICTYKRVLCLYVAILVVYTLAVSLLLFVSLYISHIFCLCVCSATSEGGSHSHCFGR